MIIRRLWDNIKKFIYYGRVGMKCYDFEMGSIYTLIYAHSKRVKKFMHSDKPYTVWSSKDKGLRRKLDEFTELCKRMDEHDDMNDNYYFGLEIEKSGGLFDRLEPIPDRPGFSRLKPLPADVKARRWKAIKKDEAIARQRLERFHYMLEHYVPRFWD